MSLSYRKRRIISIAKDSSQLKHIDPQMLPHENGVKLDRKADFAFDSAPRAQAVKINSLPPFLHSLERSRNIPAIRVTMMRGRTRLGPALEVKEFGGSQLETLS